MLSDGSPESFVFPPELERVIFEVAAASAPRSIPQLALVAWRVKIWVEPFLYRTIVVADHRPRLHANFAKSGIHIRAIESGTFTSIIHARETFVHDTVRQILLSHLAIQEETVVLSTCAAVENLWITCTAPASSPHLVARFGDLRLKRLHAAVETLFGPDANLVDFGHSFFAHITHLEIFDLPSVVDEDVWGGLAQIPRLTHLAFNGGGFIPMCRVLLRICPSLRVLCIALLSPPNDAFHHSTNQNGLRCDLRFVVLVCSKYIEDWIHGAHTGRDFWFRAEGFIEKRKSREINPLEYYLDEAETQ
ncbi:hypothetical protein DFH06DRAFT_160167 [Mycena polygramma]|nr:hypothetical protein DFH06DRAFT_160167 [Mycena polygramma]